MVSSCTVEVLSIGELALAGKKLDISIEVKVSGDCVNTTPNGILAM